MIDLKTRGSYIEGTKATMYRFFDELKSSVPMKQEINVFH